MASKWAATSGKMADFVPSNFTLALPESCPSSFDIFRTTWVKTPLVKNLYLSVWLWGIHRLSGPDQGWAPKCQGARDRPSERHTQGRGSCRRCAAGACALELEMDQELENLGRTEAALKTRPLCQHLLFCLSVCSILLSAHSEFVTSSCLWASHYDCWFT